MKPIALPLAILLLASTTNANDAKPVWQGPNKPVYVVTQNHYAEGFTPDGETARFSDLVAIEIYNPTPRKANQEVDYKVGEQIGLFLGGQQQGKVKIEKVLPFQCDSNAAVLSADAKLKWDEGMMGLATNASGIAGHANARREASAAEKEAATQLAMAEFRKHGVPETLAAKIQFFQAIVTKFDANGPKSLIAYVFIKTTAAVYEVFLIAKLEGSAPTAEFSRYHLMKDVEDGMDSEDYRFVDQLDLDGDGVDEIVIEVHYYESEEFRILKRVNGSWTRVHVGGQGGC
jgi:hypothetical protein